MSTQAIIKIGPNGGKIVGFHGTTPIYAHEVTPGHSHDHGQFPSGSPFAEAQALGLTARVHAHEHDRVEIAWRHDKAAAAEKWLAKHPGLHVIKGTVASRVIVPKAWAAKAPAVAAKPAPAPSLPPAPPPPLAPKVAAPPAPAAPKPPAAPKAAPAPVPAAAASTPGVSPLMASHGITAVDKAALKNPIASWKDSPLHPVTVDGKKGELVGWETKGAPPAKTGNLVVRFPGKGPLGGSVVAYHPSEITPEHTNAHAPWHHPDAKVYKSSTVTDSVKATMAMKAPGQYGKTMSQVIDLIQSKGVPIFYMGGFVRDALQGKASKDIDLGFGTDAGGITSIASSKGLSYVPPGKGGLVKLGKPDGSGVPPLEGKGLKGINADGKKLVSSAPSSTGTDLHAENMYGDFCHGRLWYDPVNDTIIDPTGHGVEDALTHTLRIPVPKEQWDDWAKGGPHKLYRYWKFRARGDKPADPETHKFITETAAKAFTDGSVDYFAKQNGLRRGYMGYDPEGGGYPPDAQQKLDKVRAVVIEDMGQAFWNEHFAPHIEKPYK